LNTCFLLYESITDSWKPRDAELIGQFLTRGDYKKVAEELGMDIPHKWWFCKHIPICGSRGAHP
jgi:hypothetical protein